MVIVVVSSATRRAAGAGAILLAGVATIAAHVDHLLHEGAIHTRLLGIALPLGLSIVLAAAGGWLYRSEIPDSCVHRVTLWTGIGLVGGIAFGIPVVEYQASHGVTMVDIPYLLATWATTGALSGYLIGFYDARQRQYRQRLETERDELSAREWELARQNRRLEKFASMVSHDLRNPLNVASGRVTLAQQDVESSHLTAATRALGRMETLIDDLLDLARHGRPIDESEPVSVATAAQQAWYVVDAPGASFTVDTDMAVDAVPTRLQQLFENLLRNAVDHGGPDVSIRVGALPDATGFFLEDDGDGIHEADLDEVFRDGFSTAEDGTGLGLSIVAEIVDAHGWTITADNCPAGGARFEVTGITTPD